MVKALLVSAVILTAALSAQADIALYTDGVQNGATFNWWDGVVEQSAIVHGGTKALEGGSIWVRNDRVNEPADFIRLAGNTNLTYWVYYNGNHLDDVNVLVDGGNIEFAPAGGSISYSLDGVTMGTLSAWTDIPVNTWAKVSIALNKADGWVLTPDSYYEKAGIDLHWSHLPGEHLFVDDVYLTGGTVVPPTYHDGDGNKDGMVTDADYTIWADNYGLNPGTATWEQGDYNKDLSVTDADYTIWADNYGFGVTGDVVPEPATMSLLGLLGLIRRR